MPSKVHFLKRYRDYNSYLKEIFGERVQKISLDAGLGCPNRDGTISEKGCIFCDHLGSGTGAMVEGNMPITDQIVEARTRLYRRYRAKKFIAYFQSFSNTYAPLWRLKTLYDEALTHEDVVGLSVATRPDCVDREILGLLSSYRENHLVWLEYGLQSAHDESLRRINRGHDVASFERGVLLADEMGLKLCAHVILGLPGENREMMLQTALYLSQLPVHGVKIHSLYVLKGTPLAKLWELGEFVCLGRDEYTDLVVDFLELIPPEVVIQRLTGDPGRAEIVAPLWAWEKGKTLDLIREKLERRNTWQGRRYMKSIVTKQPSAS